MIKAVIIAVTTITYVHSWYPASCCSGNDCKPVPCDQIVETKDGFVYLPTGDKFTFKQRKPSQDKNCHICVGIYEGYRVPYCVFDLQGT